MDGLKARLSFDAVVYDYDDEYLTIDTDTHIININNVSRLFGVQYDGNSKLIKFRIRNKLSDIQKMQDSIVYINWIDSRGVKGQSIAINKTISNDICEFAWKVPFDALKISGVLHFAVSAVVTKSSSSVIDQRWSTQIASVITPDGIYIKSYTPSSEEEDRIAQIYNELSKMINKQSDNLNNLQSQVNSLEKELRNLYGETISSSIMDFDAGEVDSFIPYKRSQDAGIVYVCNGNLMSPNVTWFNNNRSDFYGNNSQSDTNRVRTSTFSIPSECEYLTLSGFDRTILKLLDVRAFDMDKKSVKNGCIIIPKDGFYNIKVSLNVTDIHLLFGSTSGDVIHPNDIATMPIMLNIGKTKYDYVKSERKEIGMSIYNYGKDIPVIPSWGLYKHNTIWTYNSSIQFIFKKDSPIKVENNWKTELIQSKFNKLVSIPDYYAYDEYYELNNIVDKFTINTTADEYLTAIDKLYRANIAYITRKHFGQKDDSGTYDLYAYELDNKSYSVNNKPSILLICNQHGYEKNAAFSAYWLIDALCNHYKENKLLTFLRNEVRILIVPLANPWGFNQYVGSNVGSEIGYGNSNGININRDYENKVSKEAQFIMSASERVHNAILALDVHSNGTTRTSKDYSQLNWHSYEINSALFLVDTSDKFLSLASQKISKEMNISDTAIGVINIGEEPSNGQTLTYAWSNLSMTNLCFELPLKLPTETDEATVLCQKIGTELLVNFLGMALQKYKELVN